MIFINDNTPSHVTMRGTARYIRKMTEGLIAHFGKQVIIFSPDRQDYSVGRYLRAPRFHGIRRFGIHDALASLVAWPASPAVFYSSFFGHALTEAPEIFTVYDMTIEWMHQRGEISGGYVKRDIADKKNCLERGAALLAISTATARDIVTIYPHIQPDKISVTPIGVEEVFCSRPDEAPTQLSPQRRPYFLFVGQRGGHKNFMQLLQAYGQSGLAQQFDLRVISSAAFTTHEMELIQRHGLQASVHLINHADDNALRQYYHAAVALVYPSTREGFGLPIVEAMASGTLVITSNVSCMPEVGGEAAFYADPTDPEALVDCLRQVADLTDEDRRERIEQGRTHARTFTWERCQQQTIAVFEKVMAEAASE